MVYRVIKFKASNDAHIGLFWGQGTLRVLLWTKLVSSTRSSSEAGVTPNPLSGNPLEEKIMRLLRELYVMQSNG